MAHYQKAPCIKWKLAVPQAGQSTRVGAQPATSGENFVSLRQAELQTPRHRYAVCQSPVFKVQPQPGEISAKTICDGDRSLK